MTRFRGIDTSVADETIKITDLSKKELEKFLVNYTHTEIRNGYRNKGKFIVEDLVGVVDMRKYPKL